MSISTEPRLSRSSNLDFDSLAKSKQETMLLIDPLNMFIVVFNLAVVLLA
jgi:hypothetical protein